MDNRILLAVILSMLILLIFHYLQITYFVPKEHVDQNVTDTSPRKELTTQVNVGDLKSQDIQHIQKEIIYNITTPLYKSQLTTIGGRFINFELLKYTEDIKSKKNIQLVNTPEDGLPFEIYLASNPQLAIIPFTTKDISKTELNLSSNEKTDIILIGQTDQFLVEKKFKFKGDSYFIDLDVYIKNLSSQTITDRLLVRGVFSPFSKGSSYVFTGPFYYTDHLQEVEIKNNLTEYMGPLKYLGYMDVYFLVGVIPQYNGTFRATFRKFGDTAKREFIFWSEEFTLNPNEGRSFSFKLYMGPKRAEDLAKEYPLLAKSLYFGIFDFIAKPLLYLLKFFNNYVHNYGWSIVIVTILIRILFYPLNHMSYKSMKKMQELQPVFQKLREKYKDDPQTLQKELMNLYRTHKINPFSGCLPILIQIPVFIAFYKVLLMAIELRHAPFILWINDLSAPERLYLGSFEIPWLGGIPLLTVLMGASMFIQQKLTPTTLDPTQEKIMLILPIVFTILFINFPSGLVLYWFVNNLLSIVQQIITFKFMKTP